MTQGQQSVKSVFRVNEIISPMTVKAAGGIPERIEKIEAAFVQG